jgi:hypothetical protein
LTPQFASALPPTTVLINGHDEPRVVFDMGPLFEGASVFPFL